MPPSIPNLKQVRDLVLDIARRELPPRFARIEHSHKADGSIITEADLAVQEGIATALKQHWPQLGFLGEEMTADEQAEVLASSPNGVWCLDPLDGTNNFAAGIPYYAVSLALLQEGAVQLAVVYDPGRDECFQAERGKGAWLNEQRLTPLSAGRDLHQCMALVDFKRLPAPLSRRLCEAPPYASQRSFGAVALDWCWLAAGRVHVYLHGKQKLWDYAAGSLILAEAGGQAISLEGESVFRPSLTPRSTAAALDPDLFKDWVAWLGVPSRS